MMRPPVCVSGTPNQDLPGPRTPWRAAIESSLHQGHVQELEMHPHFASSEGRHLFDATVKISPIESINRRSTGQNGLLSESIYAPAGTRIEFRFDAPVYLLVMYEEGARREGETSIEGLDPSRVRNLADKLTFVPPHHGYHEWHETSAPIRITYLYLDPATLQNLGAADAAYVPKILFEDSVLWETAAKLKCAIEDRQARGRLYSEALAKVLVHELPGSSHGPARTSRVNRGGLASWQIRAVSGYIEEHVGEQISLATLAQLVRLSQHHFCRAFKKSFGIPPHQYHVQRRIERAKFLLADRANSVMDVALDLGYAQSSAFSVAFRKTTGQSPKQFRRDFM
jgi:AraC family transcriptional regulator